MKLYVGNLPFNATEEQIRTFFEQNGRQVSEVNLITDRETGRPRGFGFVTLPNDEHGRQAIQELDGQQMGGRPLKVNEAKERSREGGFGGGRDRGGFGGGRDRGGFGGGRR